MNLRSTIGLIFSLLLLSTPVQAQMYHVRQNATGANNGSDWNNAFTSLPQTQKRGATYYVADGDYPRLTIESSEVNTQRIMVKKATPNEHGSDIGWQNGMGDGYAYFTGATLWNGYVTVDGVTGSGSSGHGFWVHGTDVGAGAIAIRSRTLYSTMNSIEIRHIKITTAENIGTIHGIRPNQAVPISPQFEHIYFKDMWGNPFQRPGRGEILIRYCVIDTMHKYGSAHMEAIQSQDDDMDQINNWTIAHNVWKDIMGTAGLVLVGTGHKVYGNTFMWSSDRGTTLNNGIIGVSHTDTDPALNGWARNIEIYNNTFIDIRTNFFNGGSHAGHKIRNNIFVNTWTRGDDFDTKGVNWGGAEHSHNFFFNAGTHNEGDTQEQGFQHPFSSYVPFGGLNNNLHLDAATRHGFPLTAPFNLDPMNEVRGADGIWDRGVFEFVAEGTEIPAPPQRFRLL